VSRTERLIPLLVLAAGVAAYHNCLPNEFVFDDLSYIVEDRAIRSWPPREILTQSTRPVIGLSLALNYAVGGLDPRGYRALNVAIHLMAALLLYGVVRRSLETQGPRRKRSAAFAAGLAAMLWVAHPLQTQSVTYLWQRCESLMGMFYLLTLYCVIRSDASAHAVAWRAAAVISCALGMASKEVMVTAPVVVLLYDRAFLAGSWRELSRRRRGLYAALASTWLILPILMARGAIRSGRWRATWIAGYEDLSPLSYLLTQAGVILHYLRLAAWPDRLCLDYRSVWPVASSVWQAWPALLAVGGLLLLTALAWRRRPALGFVGVWFFLILAPTSSFVPLEDLVFEHRMYLPLAAVIVLGVVASVALLDRLPGDARWLQWGSAFASLGLVVALIAVTARRNLDYRSQFSIWRDTVAKAPNNPRAHRGLALALEGRGRSQEAIAQYRIALRLQPDYLEAHDNLGLALSRRGDLVDAMEHFRKALAIDPGFVAAHNNLGIALDRSGRVEEAIAHYEEALRIDPELAPTRNNLAISLGRLGRVEEAIAQYREALRIDPSYARAHYSWGTLLESLGRIQEAIAQFREALRVDPDFRPARESLRKLKAEPG
jgi:tetratricopeptide (TPR) repeat protein